MYHSTTNKFMVAFRPTCRNPSLPYGYQSLWPNSLLCPLCDWSFWASAGWRSALHLLPSSHQTHTRSKKRKVREILINTGSLGMGGRGFNRFNISFSLSISMQGQPGFSTHSESPYTLFLGPGINLPRQGPFWLILEKYCEIQSSNCSAESKQSRCSLIPETFTPCSLPEVLV